MTSMRIRLNIMSFLQASVWELSIGTYLFNIGCFSHA